MFVAKTQFLYLFTETIKMLNTLILLNHFVFNAEIIHFLIFIIKFLSFQSFNWIQVLKEESLVRVRLSKIVSSFEIISPILQRNNLYYLKIKEISIIFIM